MEEEGQGEGSDARRPESRSISFGGRCDNHIFQCPYAVLRVGQQLAPPLVKRGAHVDHQRALLDPLWPHEVGHPCCDNDYIGGLAQGLEVLGAGVRVGDGDRGAPGQQQRRDWQAYQLAPAWEGERGQGRLLVSRGSYGGFTPSG